MERANYKGKRFAEGSKARSKTFHGIAEAMAKQWAEFIESSEAYDVVDDYIQYKLFE